ncbi:MFS transporter [Streptomyces cellulosae]|uniref:MFS transporter n=1 Tax=Streptomyces cellulosae TaxID=1968 RepID=A0ABW7YD80_STRCE
MSVPEPATSLPRHGDPRRPAPTGGHSPLRILALSSFGVFVVFLDTTIVNVAFETISHSFDTTASKLAWVLNAYSLAFAAILVPAGRLADRYGRKKIFLIGLGGFALMSALCGLAPTPGVLIAGRALQAVFAALVVPTSLALVLPEFPGARRHVAVGTWGAMGAAAAACGPTLGALLTQYASWRWIFLVNVPICAAMIVSGGRILRESRDPHAGGIPDPVAVVLVAAVPAALSYAVIEGPTRGWSSAVVIAAFAGAVVLTPLLLWRSATAARPVIDLSLFRDRQFSLMNLAMLLFSVSFFGMLLSNVIFLQQVWGYSVLRAALAGAPGPLLVAFIARPTSGLAARIGFRPVLLLGGVTWMAGSVLLAAGVGASPHWATHWLPAVLLTGAGIGLTLPVQAGAAVASLPDHRSGTGSAVSQSFRQLGAVLGISLFVAVVGDSGPAQAVGAFQHVWWVFGALGLVSGLIVCLPVKARGTGGPEPAGAAGESAGIPH